MKDIELRDETHNEVNERTIIIKYGELQNHDKWVKEIPNIRFSGLWTVRLIPPFGGAVSRAWISFMGVRISLYLDCYDRLGYCGVPYWEIFPYKGDVERVAMEDVKMLKRRIWESLLYNIWHDIKRKFHAIRKGEE